MKHLNINIVDSIPDLLDTLYRVNKVKYLLKDKRRVWKNHNNQSKEGMIRVNQQTTGSLERSGKRSNKTKVRITTINTETNTTKPVKTATTVIPRTTTNPSRKTRSSLENTGHQTVKGYLQPKDLSFKTGFVGHSYNIWAQWTTDSEIPETITGFPIPLKSESPVVNCVQHPFSSDEAEFTDTELNNLLQKRVIEVTAHKPGVFISPIFVRPESDGGYRLVLNLKKTKSNCRI